MFRFILILNCAFLGVLGATFGSKCKLNEACVTRKTIEIYKNLVEEENSQLDPMFLELIEGDLETLKYTLTDTKIIGFKKCNVKSANLDLKKLEYEIEMICPGFHIEGKYDARGSLLDKHVEGKGEFNINTKAYHFKIRKDVSVTTKDDNHYLQFKKFHINATPIEDLVYDFKNLLNGQEELAYNLNKFLNENSKAIAKELQGSLITASFKKIDEISNKVLEVNSLESLFVF